jgi:glycosyltransferase involved in cell wall biosynthesis
MKIGIITPTDFIKRVPFGGADGFILSILPHLKTPSCIFGPGVNDTELGREFELYPQQVFLPIYRLKYPSAVPLRIKAFLGYMWNRRRILNSGVDVLYVHSPECALPFLFGKRRIPVVYHQHGSANPMRMATYGWARSRLLPFAGIFAIIDRMIYKRADWIVAIDRFCREQAERGGAKQKVSLIMNAVDTDTFRHDPKVRKEMRASHGCSDEDIVLLFSGRIEEVKGLDRLIMGVSELKAKGLPVRLFIAGEGSLKANLERLVKESRLDGEVRFLGMVAHSRLPGYYNMADALVLPSKMEGVPMVILEALACGTPVIATKVGGIPDLVKPEVNGVLLESAEPTCIAEAVLNIRSADIVRGRVSASIAEHSSENVGRALRGLFTRLVKNTAS